MKHRNLPTEVHRRRVGALQRLSHQLATDATLEEGQRDRIRKEIKVLAARTSEQPVNQHTKKLLAFASDDRRARRRGIITR